MYTFLTDHFKRLQYIFNPKNARKGGTIFSTTPEMHVSRSRRAVETFHADIPHNPAQHDLEGNEIVKIPKRTEYSYESGMVGAFSIVCTDEASELENLGIKRQLSDDKDNQMSMAMQAFAVTAQAEAGARTEPSGDDPEKYEANRKALLAELDILNNALGAPNCSLG
ncbi:hypothetical protein IQ07DRAFT_650322 [Pyrenochaeta sp. DS3sAY3a]|nr:hypothetical protein IQ07DRAFT_650322 [Pyrenochaeta sp. DS3sAY3a]